jgi:hypothetical protein
VAQEEEEAAA